MENKLRRPTSGRPPVKSINGASSTAVMSSELLQCLIFLVRLGHHGTCRPHIHGNQGFTAVSLQAALPRASKVAPGGVVR